MYRRRHHCRMCGQVFCNPCSSHYIDGALINLQGLVRSCRLCHDQLLERTERENKALNRRRQLDWTPPNPKPNPGSSDANPKLNPSRDGKKGLAPAPAPTAATTATTPTPPPTATTTITSANGISELLSQKQLHTDNLQTRASGHLQLIVDRLVETAPIASDSAALWKTIAVNLVREVVSSVDPNVRRGDSMDIRPYVKIKTIPGGGLDENAYVDGVVFRKNVSHKKMIEDSTKVNPKILLLAGGLEFQRTDTRLSSMDTLIEQEDRYLEILVDKIMSLRPDIILVGKAVARKAQELLCSHNVVVMQGVKPQLLERISRASGAMMLPSTDHMIQQYGEECLGVCGRFWLRLVRDDPERLRSIKQTRVLGDAAQRGATYAYLEGCPPELGCTIVLRGADRDTLKHIKEIIRFSVMVAYHLRLEVAYYNDRSAQLNPNPSNSLTPAPASSPDGPYIDDDESSDDGKHFEGVAPSPNLNPNYNSTPAPGSSELSDESKGDSPPNPTPSPPNANDKFSLSKLRNRLLLSASLDVDIGLPYKHEIQGLNRRFVGRNYDK